MNTTEQKLNHAKRTFEKAAGPVTTNDAICLVGEGLAPLVDAVIGMSRDLDEIRRELEFIKKSAAKRPK